MADRQKHLGLFTDLYELTMAAAYFENQFTAKASFELFVRSLPRERSFLLTAGLEQALEYLENVRFGEEEIEYLRRQPVFGHISDGFFDYLRDFRFTGEVWAVPEGTPVFGEEPLLRVTAPIIQAQVIETFLLSSLTFQTMIASKAARVVEAAERRNVVEFGSRRAHGPGAGLLAARAAYIGGCAGTSNVEAGRRFGIPVFGTMAHSFVMAYAKEEEAFQRFQQLFPEHGVLLIDTYDTLAAIDKIIQKKLHPTAVRLDSGDLLDLATRVRQKLDQAGLNQTRIFASGDLNEFTIADLLARGAPIDAFGVGTALATSKDAPTLGGVYKLVDLESETGILYRAKFSEEKTTYPGPKQIFRFPEPTGVYRRDVIGRQSEKYSDAVGLLELVMRDGKRIEPSPSIENIQRRASEELRKIPATCRRLRDATPYPVTFSKELENLLATVRQQTLKVAEAEYS
jgi:nicotinate phosphoribosyltransferase